MFSTKCSCGKTANRHEDEAFDVAFSVVVLIAKESESGSPFGSGVSNYWHTFHNSQRFSSIKSLRCSDR